jgi:hypothetical protein
MKLAVLSVHYLHPGLLTDQIDRLRLCAGPVRRDLEADLRLYAIVHGGSSAEVVKAVESACGHSSGFATCLDLRRLPPEVVPVYGALSHGHSLAAAYRLLRKGDDLAAGDLVAVLDHDAHPLDDSLFAALGQRLLSRSDLAGIGIPQWYHGRCYLHPSLLCTRVAILDEIGPEAAFQTRRAAHRNDPGWYDTGEGFTIWCEVRRRPILPLRVISTEFPFDHWDSDMAVAGRAELTGWHGEPVRIGHLMRFGLLPECPLVSHIGAGFLGPYQKVAFSRFTWPEVLAAYLAEELAE